MDNDSIKRLRESLDGHGSQIQKVLAEQKTKDAATIYGLAKLIATNPEMIVRPAQQIAQYLAGVDKQRELFISRIDKVAIQKFAEDMDELQNSIASAAMKVSLATQTIASYANRVVLPKLAIADHLANGINQSLQNMLREYDVRVPGIQQAMVAMQNPWIDLNNASRSIRGFSEMQVIGQALDVLPSYGVETSALLRVDLGDWRDQVTVPNTAFAEPQDRTTIYVERGLNTELTDFPDAAFQESLFITGLKREAPAIVGLYGSPVPSFDLWNEEELARNNEAHNWLQRLEMQMRNFIDKLMTSTYGQGWEKHRLPGGFYDSWMAKKEKAVSAGESPYPLIAYADFTDYVPLMCKKDNWPLFSPFFDRTDSLRESFQRLYPIRIGTMHARMITQDDQIFLFVEARRLMNATMKSRQSP